MLTKKTENKLKISFISSNIFTTWMFLFIEEPAKKISEKDEMKAVPPGLRLF